MPTRIAWVVCLVLLASCHPKFLAVTQPRTLENYLAIIEESGKRVSQLKASVDIRGNGLLGQFFHERADIMVMSPHFLLWSLRSFFETPAQILASNGEVISLYDFSAESEPFRQIVIDKNSVIDLFEFPFHPISLVNLFLSKIELAASRNLQIGVLGDLWRIEADQGEGWHILGIFDASARVFKEIAFENVSSKIKYQVKYSDMSLVDGILFPKLLTVLAEMNGRTLKFNVRFDQLHLNGPKLLPDTFILKPH